MPLVTPPPHLGIDCDLHTRPPLTDQPSPDSGTTETETNSQYPSTGRHRPGGLRITVADRQLWDARAVIDRSRLGGAEGCRCHSCSCNDAVSRFSTLSSAVIAPVGLKSGTGAMDGPEPGDRAATTRGARSGSAQVVAPQTPSRAPGRFRRASMARRPSRDLGGDRG